MTTLVPRLATESCGSAVLCVRFSPDDAFLAAASERGPIYIYNVATGKEGFRLNRGGLHPVKQVCWRPERSDASLRTRGVLVGVSTAGVLQQWHVTSARCLSEFGPDDEDCQLFCVDYSPDGTQIVAGGLHHELLVYDEETKKQTLSLQSGDSLTTAGHSSRIFAARFSDCCTVLSGGWDNSIQFWDLRVGHAVRAIYGPHICGDSLDISSDKRHILTGSWRPKEALEIWDIGTGRREETIPWRKTGSADPPCLLYAACFSRDAASSFIASGGSCGSAANVHAGGEAKVIQRESTASGLHCAGTLAHALCLSAHFSSPAASSVAFGGYDGRVRIVEMVVS